MLRSRSPRAWRGADRLDRPLHGSRASTRPPRRSGCAMPPACSPISAGARIPTIAASSRSTSSPMRPSSRSIIRAARISRSRCSSAMSGLVDDELSPHVRELASTRMLDRARVLGAALRVAYRDVGLDAGRAAAHADGGRARQAEAEAARQVCGACRRAAVRPAAPARAPDRPRAGDRDGLGRIAVMMNAACAEERSARALTIFTA